MFESVVKKRRVQASAVHLIASVVLALAVSGLVFGLWYPPPYTSVAGGTGLFGLLITVDVIMGPALTAVAAGPSKPVPELRRDLLLIVALQLGALGYGLYTMAMARPIYLSFEVDRMRVVVAADIDPASLATAPPEFRSLPWTGPRLLAAVKPTDPNEQLKAFDLGMAGVDLSMVPSNWRSYASQAAAVWAAAKPVSALLERHPELAGELDAMASASGQARQALRYLPFVSRHASWVTVIAQPNSRVVGHLPVDGFF